MHLKTIERPSSYLLCNCVYQSLVQSDSEGKNYTCISQSASGMAEVNEELAVAPPFLRQYNPDNRR